MTRDLGVYVHWPYCARICPYSDFNVVRDRGRTDEQTALADAIVADLVAQRALTGERRLLSIFFGGGTPSLMDPQAVARVIDTVGLRDRLKHRPSELSGGQQQRVAVARALASRPEIIFADEPTGNLDSKTGAEILTFMRSAVKELGQTIVMVTHDPVAASYADRVVFLADGRIVDEMSQPTAERVLDRMKNFGD